MKKTILTTLTAAMVAGTVAAIAPAAEAATVIVKNNTQAAVVVSVETVGRSYNNGGPNYLYNPGSNTQTFLDVTSINAYVDFFRPAPLVSGNLHERVTTTGYKVTEDDTVFINYWQEAPGWFSYSIDVTTENGEWKGNLH